MQCYHCGGRIPWGRRGCPSCGQPRSWLVYVHLWGVVGGVAGSLMGYTLGDFLGALVGGLAGILFLECLGHWLLPKLDGRQTPPTSPRQMQAS